MTKPIEDDVLLRGGGKETSQRRKFKTPPLEGHTKPTEEDEKVKERRKYSDTRAKIKSLGRKL